jgi:hypothetical protein
MILLATVAVATGPFCGREMYESLGHLNSLQELGGTSIDRASLRDGEKRGAGDLARHRRQLIVEHRGEVTALLKTRGASQTFEIIGEAVREKRLR